MNKLLISLSGLFMLFSCSSGGLMPTSNSQELYSNPSISAASSSNFPISELNQFLYNNSITGLSLPTFKAYSYTTAIQEVNGNNSLIVYGFYNSTNETGQARIDFTTSCISYGYSIDSSAASSQGFYKATNNGKVEILFAEFNSNTSHQFSVVYSVKKEILSSQITSEQIEWTETLQFPLEELYEFYAKRGIDKPYTGHGAFYIYAENYKYRETTYLGQEGFLIRIHFESGKLLDAWGGFLANLGNNGYETEVSMLDSSRRKGLATNGKVKIIFGTYKFTEDEKFIYGVDLFFTTKS